MELAERVGASESLTGKWQVTAEFYGTPTYGGLQLEQTGEKLSGKFHGEKLEGTVEKRRWRREAALCGEVQRG